jgi:hypothetical protein
MACRSVLLEAHPGLASKEKAMKAFLTALALATPFTAVAQTASTKQEPGHQARLYERYCEKLREAPRAYGQFVNRMRLVTGFTATDFATYDGSAPGIAACPENAQKLAAAQPQAKEKTPR